MTQKIKTTADLYNNTVVLQKAFLKDDTSVRLLVSIQYGVIHSYLVYNQETTYYNGEDLGQAIVVFNMVVEFD